jgi:hypothetical protein
VLREAEVAPWLAPIAYVVTGALAVYGVFSLARNHPQLKEGATLPLEEAAERAVKRGSRAGRMR